MQNRFLTQNPYFNDGKWILGDDLTGFMLHSVGVGQPDPMVFIRSWDRPDYTSAGINGFIGAEEIYLTASCLDTPGRVKRMPHGGKRAVNDHYIGFEMTEPAQIRYTTGANFTVSNRAAAQEFVKQTYANAVTLFADLCAFHGKDPLQPGVIVSHNEAGLQGLATGHVDPEHLWRGLGMNLTMDGFRRDVADRLAGKEDEMTKQEIEALIDQRIQSVLNPDAVRLPAWAEEEFAAAVAAGITDGSRPNGYATRLEAALMALRATQNREII